jgi:YD repeat-containing protein
MGLFSVQAQNNPLNQVTIASPTAASLGKYADIPVSYHTGIPDISIPLYTIKEGPLAVPVTVSYHSSGLKVLETSSSVGAGWTLNAGGAITRTVRGAPDDRGLLAAHTKYGYFHEYGIYNYLFGPGGGGCPQQIPCPVGAPFAADDAGVANNILDGEPDLYFFNFNGYTGKFYFNDDRTPILVPQQDLKIEPILADESSSVAYISMPGFIVTTPDGTKYYFGKNQEADGNMDAIEKSFNISPQVAFTGQGAVSSWFLNKISSADDQFSVKFLYQPDRYSHHNLSMFPIWNVNGSDFLNPFGSHEYNLAKIFIDGVKLQQIVFSQGTVNFNSGLLRNDLEDFYFKAITDQPNNEATSLGSISINGPDNFCKKYTFSQSYFVDNSTPATGYYQYSWPVANDKTRLRLDAIQEQSCDGSLIVPPYRFNYFEDGGPNFAPRRLTFGQDHWGYYNGAVNNQSLVPAYWENNVSKDGADRDAHWPAMRIGALKRITYPMGGFTDLEFEPNNTYGTIFSQVATSVYSRGVGYTATSTYDEITMNFSGNLHEVSMSNANAGSVASIQIENSAHNGVFSLPVEPGQNKTDYFTLPRGTYKVMLYKSTPGPQSGYGASANIKEIVPTNTTGNIMVGGLRIKTITKHDGITNTDVVTNYNYTVTGGTQSSGVLYSRPVYVSLVRNNIVKQIGWSPSTQTCSLNGCFSCDASTGQAYYKSGGEIFPMVTTQGNHIGYNDVKVSQTGNGYSIYRFYGSSIWGNINNDIVTRRVNNTVCDAATPNFPPAPVPFDYKRGDLKYQGHFTEAGKAIAESYFNSQYEVGKIKTPALIVTYITPPNNGQPTIWGTEYDLQSYRKISQEVISYTTDPATGKYISSTNREFYGSAFHNMPTRTEQETSTGSTLVTNTKYAMDFRLSTCDNIADGWDSYLNAYNTTATTYSNSLNCTSGTWNCRWLAYQQFRYDRSIARKNYVSYRRANFTDPGNAFSVNHANAKNAADAILKPILELQDEYKNEAIEVSTFRGNLLTGSTFTNFGFAGNPSTKVYPVKTRLINVYNPTAVFTAAATSANNQSVVSDNRYLDDATYSFSKGNVIEGTPKNGLTIAYLWGYPNNSPIAKITNAHSNEVAFTSFENGEQEGNWSISDNSRNTTNKITGRKSYDLSSGRSITANIPAGKQYVVSYWAINGAATVSANGASVAATPTGLSKGGFTYYEHTLPNSTTNVVVTGSGITIDEVRLYPVDAEMETWCYTPVLGIINGCDKNNRITYYEYDALGRVAVIRDQDANIVKTYKYNYKQ